MEDETLEMEVQVFTKALELARDEFYLDSIALFQKFITIFPESELVDDALFNIGLCHFNLNDFENAIQNYQLVIDTHPEGTIKEFEDSTDFGKTAAKCHYALLNCYLGMGKVELAKSQITSLGNYPESYVLLPTGEKETFKELAERAIKVYEEKVL